jgi:hypothetical protein
MMMCVYVNGIVTRNTTTCLDGEPKYGTTTAGKRVLEYRKPVQCPTHHFVITSLSNVLETKNTAIAPVRLAT